MAFTRIWDAAEETTPANSDKIRLGAGKIRDSKVNIRERLQIDHEFSTLSSGTDSGFHKRVTLLKTTIAEPASGYVELAAVANVLHYFGQGDADRTLVDLSLSQTLVNKTLTAPVIATIVNSGVLTLPTGAETLVGRATTDTLTNKTLTAAANTIVIAHGDLSDDPATGVHGVGAGNVVGTALSQTLTNKTIAASANTITISHGQLSNDPVNGVHGVTSGAVVGTILTQTLTNKTLTTPTIASMINAQHAHDNAAGGGTIDHTDLTTIGTNTHAQIDSHIASGSVHGISGDLVGTSSTQTLTNKTIEGDNNTIKEVASVKDLAGFANGGVRFKTWKVIWDMDADATISVTHGVDQSRVLFAQTSILNDLGTIQYELVGGIDGTAASTGFTHVTSTSIIATREVSGDFDNTNFNVATARIFLAYYST